MCKNLANITKYYKKLLIISKILKERIKKVEDVLKVGDKVIFSKYAGTEIKVDGEEYIILRQSDILAVVEL